METLQIKVSSNKSVTILYDVRYKEILRNYITSNTKAKFFLNKGVMFLIGVPCMFILNGDRYMLVEINNLSKIDVNMMGFKVYQSGGMFSRELSFRSKKLTIKEYSRTPQGAQCTRNATQTMDSLQNLIMTLRINNMINY